MDKFRDGRYGSWTLILSLNDLAVTIFGISSFEKRMVLLLRDDPQIDIDPVGSRLLRRS
jgi:hypothetical protein